MDYMTEPFFYPHCRTEWKGDGYCDCFCMNEACEYDDGDCENHDCSSEKESDAQTNMMKGMAATESCRDGNTLIRMSSIFCSM